MEKITIFEMCRCGHFGGESPNIMNEDRYQYGLGVCRECNCNQFTWVGFVDSNGTPLSHDEIQQLAKERREELAN